MHPLLQTSCRFVFGVPLPSKCRFRGFSSDKMFPHLDFKILCGSVEIVRTDKSAFVWHSDRIRKSINIFVHFLITSTDHLHFGVCSACTITVYNLFACLFKEFLWWKCEVEGTFLFFLDRMVLALYKFSVHSNKIYAVIVSVSLYFFLFVQLGR